MFNESVAIPSSFGGERMKSYLQPGDTALLDHKDEQR